MDELRDIESFLSHANAIESRIASMEAAGEEVPAEARLMLQSLRDLAQAVDGLRSSITGDDAPAAAQDATGGTPSPDTEEQ